MNQYKIVHPFKGVIALVDTIQEVETTILESNLDWLHKVYVYSNNTFTLTDYKFSKN